jgi:hypothetical protein
MDRGQLTLHLTLYFIKRLVIITGVSNDNDRDDRMHHDPEGFEIDCSDLVQNRLCRRIVCLYL